MIFSFKYDLILSFLREIGVFLSQWYIPSFNSQISSIAAGSIFMFYGPHKAVLITYPYKEFQKI